MLWASRNQAGEEVIVAHLACPGPDLVDGCVNLTYGGDVSLASFSGQRLANLTERAVDRTQPASYVAPPSLRVGWHEIEYPPDFLCLAGDNAHSGCCDVGVVELDLQAKPFQHRFLRGVLAFIGWCGSVQCGDGTADVVDSVC